MPSPILALEHNLIEAFENANGNAANLLGRAVEEGRLEHEFRLDEDESSPRGPHIALRIDGCAEIAVHVPHLEMLWAFIYGWAILFEEGVQKPRIAGTFTGLILLDSPLKQRAAALLEWAAALRSEYSPWPPGLPTPAHSDSAEEARFAGITNSIFTQSATFFVFHELAHVELRHLDFVHRPDAVPVDDATAIEMERDADDFAFRVMVSDPAVPRQLTAWPILAAVLSSLYLVQCPAGVFQQRHPHLHHRADQLLEKLELAPGEGLGYFETLVATIFAVTLRSEQTSGDFAPEVFDTARDAINAALDRIDAQNEGINNLRVR